MAFLFRTIAFCFWVGLALATVCFALGTMSGAFADRLFLAELASHFQWQFVGLLAIASAIFALDGRFRWATFALVFAVGAWAYHLLPLYAGVKATVSQPRSLRLVSANVAFFNEQQDAFVAFLREEKPDVALVYELSPSWQQKLKELETEYPYFQTRPIEGHAGIGIYSRLAFNECRIETVGQNPSPAIVATLPVDGQTLTIVAAHPDPPINMASARSRNQQLEDLAKLIRTLPMPLVLAGDFNTSSWNPAFKKLSYITGLRDSRVGFGAQNSWNTSLPLMRTTIDHCLVSPGVEVIDRRVGPYVGSDHYPIIVDLLVN